MDHSDPQVIAGQLQALKLADDLAGDLRRLRELEDAVKNAAPADRHSRRALAAELTVQSIDYLCVAIERGENRPEVKRRFSVAIQRADLWAAICGPREPADTSRTVPIS